MRAVWKKPVASVKGFLIAVSLLEGLACPAQIHHRMIIAHLDPCHGKLVVICVANSAFRKTSCRDAVLIATQSLAAN